MVADVTVARRVEPGLHGLLVGRGRRTPRRRQVHRRNERPERTWRHAPEVITVERGRALPGW